MKPEDFTQENEVPKSLREHVSPSGRFKLVVSAFSRGPGTWSYTQGKVFALGSDEPIAVVQRNYGAFPFLFVEDHPNGKSYLVCGEDYQGQTVIELETGRRRDFLPEAAAKGHGFCWAEVTFNVQHQMLVVDGCIWACPYEYRFYDFSDPMAGWPEISLGDEWVEADNTPPSFSPEGIMTTHETREVEEEGSDEPARVVQSTKTFKREGLSFVLLEEWVSDEEKARRVRQAENERKYKEWQETFKAKDPLYLTYREALKDPALNPADYESIGVTHDTWCPDFKGNERRWCRRILSRKEGSTQRYTIDFEWAVETGPVKLQIFKDGNTFESKFYPHTVEGVLEAFAHAVSLAKEGAT